MSRPRGRSPPGRAAPPPVRDPPRVLDLDALCAGRRESGSFWTPPPLVAFMCREALAGYLDAVLAALPRAAGAAGLARRLAAPPPTPPVPLDPAAARAALAALEGVRVCDPACGSGAHLVGMLRELLELRARLAAAAGEAAGEAASRRALALDIAARALRGVDIDPLAVELARLRLRLAVEWTEPGVRPPAPAFEPDVRVGDSLAGTPAGEFDVVLANPPYLRMERLGERRAALRRDFPRVYDERADLYVYFFARALELLRPGGVMAVLSPSRWLRARYGAPLRAHLAASCRILSITDFGELPVFGRASTFPMILVARREPGARSTPTWTQVASLDPPYPDVAAVKRARGVALPASAIRGDDWLLAPPGPAGRVRRMRAGAVPLGRYVDGRIQWGIKTGLNAAFVVDDATRAALLRASPGSAAVLRPLAVGADVRRWCVRDRGRWLLYLHRDVDRGALDGGALDAVLEHLRPFRARLEARATRRPWYELQQPQRRYAAGFDAPKIVYPVIAREPRFALDRRGFYVNDKVFALPVEDLYLLAVLNSAPAWRFLRAVCAVLGDPARGGRLELRRVHMARLPIPAAASADRAALAELAARCQDAAGAGPEVAAWEAEIDERVAALYGGSP